MIKRKKIVPKRNKKASKTVYYGIFRIKIKINFLQSIIFYFSKECNPAFQYEA